MNELEQEVECPVCMTLEGDCPRCHGTGFVRMGDLTEEEIAAREQLLHESDLAWEGLD